MSKTLKEYEKTPQSSNNYHHNRISLLLAAIESIALANKLKDFKWELEAKPILEISASIFVLLSIGADIRYNALKSIRELPGFAEKKIQVGNAVVKTYPSPAAGYINTAADIQRGGWKLASGGLSMVAGLLSAGLDFISFSDELTKKRSDPILLTIYFSRMATGSAAAWYSLKIGFSYTAPLLMRAGLGETMIYTLAKKLSERVALLLFFARLNAIGLGITVIQLLYLWLKDDDLQNWLEKCTFRKEKIAESALTKYSFSAVRLTYSTETYPSLQKELEEMNMAFAEVTGQTVETPGKEEESSNEPDDHLWNPN